MQKTILLILCAVFFIGLGWHNYTMHIRVGVLENNMCVIDMYLDDVERDMVFFDTFMMKISKRVQNIESQMYSGPFNHLLSGTRESYDIER